ncbi:hypothetical protein Bca4012_006325 [Brassica carinata]
MVAVRHMTSADFIRIEKSPVSICLKLKRSQQIPQVTVFSVELSVEALTGIHGRNKLHSSSQVQKRNRCDLVQAPVVDVGLSPYRSLSSAVVSASLNNNC